MLSVLTLINGVPKIGEGVKQWRIRISRMGLTVNGIQRRSAVLAARCRDNVTKAEAYSLNCTKI